MQRTCPSCGHEIDLTVCPVVSTAAIAETPAHRRRLPVAADEEFPGEDDAEDPFSRSPFPAAWSPRPSRTPPSVLTAPSPGIGAESEPGTGRATAPCGSTGPRAAPAARRSLVEGVLRQRSAPAQRYLIRLEQFPPAELARRRRPDCRIPLPVDIDTRSTHIVGVVGLNAAGKSNFLAASLVACARGRGLAASGCTEFTPDVETAGVLQTRYFNRLFREGTALGTTQAQHTVRRDRLVFRVTYPRYRPFLMVTHDQRRAADRLAPPLRRGRLPACSVGSDLHRRPCRVSGCPRAAVPGGHARRPAGPGRPPRRLHPGAAGPSRRPQGPHRRDDLEVGPARPRRFAPDAIPAAVAHDRLAERPADGQQRIRQLLLDMGETKLVDVADAYGSVIFHAVSALGGAPRVLWWSAVRGPDTAPTRSVRSS